MLELSILNNLIPNGQLLQTVLPKMENESHVTEMKAFGSPKKFMKSLQANFQLSIIRGQKVRAFYLPVTAAA